MIDPALQAAMDEAYASAPDIVAWTTIELWHPTFDVPARVILDHGILLSEAPVVWGRRLTLEDDAPRDAGTEVTFTAAAINVTYPGFEDGQQQELTLSIDNVSGSLVPVLKRAIEIDAEIDVVARQWLETDLTTPSFILGGLTLRRVTASAVRVEGKALFALLREKAFGLTYRKEEFPSLVS